MSDLHVFLLQPTTLFAARVDMASIVYPLDSLTFDGVTTGAYTDIVVGQTLLLGSAAGLDDYGRTVVRAAPTSTTIPVGRSSRGTRDGELEVIDNAYITVANDHRVWAKIPFIDSAGTIYKDSDLTVSDRTTTPPPVANAGPPVVGTIDDVTGVLNCQLPHEANTSFAVSAGATITGYLWSLPAGVALSGGSLATDSQILVDANPGFYWIALTVTDSNAKTHIARTFIFARDPDADVSIPGVDSINLRVMRQGKTCEIRTLQPIPATTYPDGTLVVVMDGEPNSLSDRGNVVFWGWHQTDPAEITATRTGTLAGTTLQCVDVAGRLDSLPGFSMAVYDDGQRDTAEDSAITWSYMVDANVDKLLHYLLQWHSTALDVADWTWSGTTTTFPFTVLEAGGESLFDQVNRKAAVLMPDHYFVCNQLGQLAVRVNPMLQDAADRTATVQANITVQDWSQIRYIGQRPPTVHWLEGSAILASATTVTAVFCKAPGDSPGQGEQERTHGEQLALSQSQLNAVTGHRYAQINAPQSQLRISLIPSQYLRATTIDPAALTWCTLNISAALAAQRGLIFASERGLIHELTVRWESTRTGVVRSVETLWERETEGTPAVTVVPADAEPVDDGNDWWYVPPPWTPPPDLGIIEGQNVIAVISQVGKLYRTSDFQSSPPTWTEFDLSTGGINNVAYSFVVDPFSPGYLDTVGGAINGWLATEDYLYRINDIFGATPIKSIAHTFAVQANDTAFKDFRTVKASFGQFFPDVADNPWVAVATYYWNHGGLAGVYVIHSEDGGVTWSSENAVDLTEEYNGNGFAERTPIGLYLSPKTPGLAYVAAYFDPGTGTPPFDPPFADGYVSQDWGETWARLSNPNIDPGDRLAGDIHVPWPTNDDEDIVYHGRMDKSATRNFSLFRVDGTGQTNITPVEGGVNFGVNTPIFGVRTYDDDRKYVAMAGCGNDSDLSFNSDILGAFVSDDYGDTWTTIVTPAGRSSPHPESIAFAGDNPNILFIWGLDYITYSSNFGTTIEDKDGNLTAFTGSQYLIGLCGGPLTA